MVKAIGEAELDFDAEIASTIPANSGDLDYPFLDGGSIRSMALNGSRSPNDKLPDGVMSHSNPTTHPTPPTFRVNGVASGPGVSAEWAAPKGSPIDERIDLDAEAEADPDLEIMDAVEAADRVEEEVSRFLTESSSARPSLHIRCW
ncbi:hypothetical protein BD410DRAFT_791002 [Rickenella mellea]|uniref:Uncharacterized protein n=1 Tax=Rickenella mellea TaxID=50990 RepID=A0A4Y7PYL5_9AGAM|nr:hypothetical protein BD410DRAFT_791002 [Rickenella mellea]